MFNSLKKTIYDNVTNAYANIVPPPKLSQFLQKGVLTPSEFEDAGDQLVSSCGWQWNRAQSEKHESPHLHKEKQYLSISTQSRFRAKDLVSNFQGVEVMTDDDWIVHNLVVEEKNNNLDNQEFQKIDDNYVQDKQSDQREVNKDDGKDIIKVEQPEDIWNYNVYITYDHYEYVPRLWLSGFDSDDQPLSQDMIFQDISDEYAKKTVTYESFQYKDEKMLTIHPCKHANVIKHFIDQATEGGGKIAHHQALILFLKFMNSVIPTIEYDHSPEILFTQ